MGLSKHERARLREANENLDSEDEKVVARARKTIEELTRPEGISRRTFLKGTAAAGAVGAVGGAAAYRHLTTEEYKEPDLKGPEGQTIDAHEIPQDDFAELSENMASDEDMFGEYSEEFEEYARYKNAGGEAREKDIKKQVAKAKEIYEAREKEVKLSSISIEEAEKILDEAAKARKKEKEGRPVSERHKLRNKRPSEVLKEKCQHVYLGNLDAYLPVGKFLAVRRKYIDLGYDLAEEKLVEFTKANGEPVYEPGKDNKRPILVPSVIAKLLKEAGTKAGQFPRIKYGKRPPKQQAIMYARTLFLHISQYRDNKKSEYYNKKYKGKSNDEMQAIIMADKDMKARLHGVVALPFGSSHDGGFAVDFSSLSNKLHRELIARHFVGGCSGTLEDDRGHYDFTKTKLADTSEWLACNAEQIGKKAVKKAGEIGEDLQEAGEDFMDDAKKKAKKVKRDWGRKWRNRKKI